VKSASLPGSRDPRVASVKDAYAGSIVMPGNIYIKDCKNRYDDKLPLSASWRVSRCSGNHPSGPCGDLPSGDLRVIAA